MKKVCADFLNAMCNIQQMGWFELLSKMQDKEKEEEWLVEWFFKKESLRECFEAYVEKRLTEIQEEFQANG